MDSPPELKANCRQHHSSVALAAGRAKTLQGQSVTIAVKGHAALVNKAQLIATDLDASNGVIHVIDTVLLPAEGKQASATPHQLIESAIHEGAPLFNACHPGECAKVYMTTAKQIMARQYDHLGFCLFLLFEMTIANLLKKLHFLAKNRGIF